MHDAEAGRPENARRMIPVQVTDEPGVCGLLRVSWFADGSPTSDPATHVTTYVNGPLYSGMQDNDLRGFLDGSFLWGWNQTSQGHVRVGRLFKESRDPVGPPQFGEEELFRLLQRWEGIRLPQGSTVSNARLVLNVERGPDTPLRVMLYAVNKDWNPGGGGIEGNNASPPKRGEVWWNDVGFEEEAWGLPGVGFAARGHVDADTDVMALADAIYQPGECNIVLESDELAAYATARIAAGEPLLFLVKLSDHHEDIPGTLIDFYSGDYGSAYCEQRPRLILEWSSETELKNIDERVRLEYGRTHVIPGLAGRQNADCAISFFPDPGYDQPTLDIKEAGSDGANAAGWSSVVGAFKTKPGRFDLRVSAARNRLFLGETFDATVRDTWVSTAPLEQQIVRWAFVAPSGSEHTAEGAFEGDYRWRVAFVPDEIGPWHYTWTHQFIPEGFMSPEGRFDVVPGSLEAVNDQLRKLASDVETAVEGDDPVVVEELRERFYRLQRAAMLLQDPESFRSESGLGLKHLHNEIRGALSGRPIPDPIPLVSSPPVFDKQRRPASAGWKRAAKRAIRSAKRLSMHLLT